MSLPKPSLQDLAAIPDPEQLHEKLVLTEDGRPSGLTLPVKDMSIDSYKREMQMRTGQQKMMKRLLASMPAQQLQFALAYSEKPKALAFLEALVDPRNEGRDIARLALENGIGLGELMNIWRNDRLAQAVTEVFNRVPTVAKHTSEDAQSADTCCPRCDGGGEIRVQREEGYVWIKCVNCKGTGTVRKVRDSRSREHVLKATGIIKSDQAMVVVNNNVVAGPENVIDELDRLGKVVEVEPAEEVSL